VYATERQREILDKARAEGRVEVRDLAESLGVTSETVRRDLSALERRGVLHRVHGGAIPVERLGIEPAVAEREARMSGQKERIAKAALDELPDDGGTIILDAGTTTIRLAELLPTDRELIVTTRCRSPSCSQGARTSLHVAAARPWPHRSSQRLGGTRHGRHLRRRRVPRHQRPHRQAASPRRTSPRPA
jgi:DeoR family fructose operon transcriptional repressor